MNSDILDTSAMVTTAFTLLTTATIYKCIFYNYILQYPLMHRMPVHTTCPYCDKPVETGIGCKMIPCGHACICTHCFLYEGEKTPDGRKYFCLR